MSDDYDRAAELAAIRSRAEDRTYKYREDRDGFYIASVVLSLGGGIVMEINEPEDYEYTALCDLVQAQHDRLTLLSRLDAAEAERDAIAQAADSMATAFNAAFERLGEQRDSAYALLSNVCMYLERLPSRTPERERLITAIHMQLGPSSSRIDELP